MSRALASAVLSALKSTAILVTSHSEKDETVFLYRASTGQLLAAIGKEYDELFESDFFEIVPPMGMGFRKIATTLPEFITACESLKGYPTEADMRRNWSKPVYVVTDY